MKKIITELCLYCYLNACKKARACSQTDCYYFDDTIPDKTEQFYLDGIIQHYINGTQANSEIE